MHIEIEKMLFGDYRVQVWNESLNSELDREYFCRGYTSAFMTALQIRSLGGFGKLDIFSRDMDEVTLVDKYEEKSE